MEHPPMQFADMEPEELDDMALNLCEINTASWSSNHAPWGLSQRLNRGSLAELSWDIAAARSGASVGAAPLCSDADDDGPASNYHDLNSESCSSRGSGVGAAALNYCDVNTASWSSRDSRSPWSTLGAAAAAGRTRSTEHGVRGAEDIHSHHEANACSWRSRGSAAGMGCLDANAASWGSASARFPFHPGGARRSTRSVKELLEDFALFNATASESASSTEAPRGSGEGEAAHRPPARLEAGSIAALQAELAQEPPSGPSHHHPRIQPHTSTLLHHPIWAKFDHGHTHLGALHGHAPGGLAHGVGGHHALAVGHHALAPKHIWESSAHVDPPWAAPAAEPLEFAFRVSAAKFQSKDRQVVSEMFHIRFGDVKVPFRVRLTAKLVHRHKHGQCFRTARGRGRLELKCEGVPPENSEAVRFAFSIGSREQPEKRSEPIEHDFSGSSVGGLPASIEDWDFKAAIDAGTASCEVTLAILPSASKSAQQGLGHSAHGDFVVPEGQDELGFSPGGHLSTIAEDAMEKCG